MSNTERKKCERTRGIGCVYYNILHTVHILIYIYICIYICIYIYVYIYVYICIYICIYICVCLYIYKLFVSEWILGAVLLDSYLRNV